jgi:hypothetical protein
LDLQEFFGVNGWYGLEEVNAERRQYPWMDQLGTNWEDEFISPGYMPEFPHRRKAVVHYYRQLANLPKDERARAISFLHKLQAMNNTDAVREGLDYVNNIPADPLARKNRLDMLADPSLATFADKLPRFLQTVPEADRKALRGEVEMFLKYLPTGADPRRFITNHMTEITQDQRKRLLNFLDTLPDDPVQREEKMKFLEKWNNNPDEAWKLGWPIFSIWFHVTNPTEMAVAHVVILSIMVMFTLGLFTKVTSVLTWLAAVSYIHRTQQVLFGMDTMMNLLLIFLMIGPCGKALSLDRWLACRKIKKSGKTGPAVDAFLARPEMSSAAGFAQRLVQIHFCFIYMAAGLSKLKGQTWWNHSAFWDTVANPEFTLIHYRFYEEVLKSMVAWKPMYGVMAAGTVLFTFVLEIGLPFLVWTRLRPIMVIGGVLFHFGIGLFMGLNIFALLMMALLLSYIPGEVIHAQIFGRAAKK